MNNSIEINNDRYLRLLSYYLNDYDKAITKQQIDQVKSVGVDTKTAFCYLLAGLFGLEVESKDREFFNQYIVPSVHLLDVNDYYNDKYYKTISFNGEKLNDCTLTYLTYQPYQGFVCNDYVFCPDGRVIPQIGFFETEYRYPAILEKGVEWMTLLPNEINSQVKYIDNAFGKVLTYGLGLGYYQFMVALKLNVTSVTIVDLNNDVITLFKTHILPKFPEYARNKINIVCQDAFEFAKNLKDGDYDYIYADIWHDCGDGTPLYKKFKECEKYCKTAKYGYWIEDSIKYYL